MKKISYLFFVCCALFGIQSLNNVAKADDDDSIWECIQACKRSSHPRQCIMRCSALSH